MEAGRSVGRSMLLCFKETLSKDTDLFTQPNVNARQVDIEPIATTKLFYQKTQHRPRLIERGAVTSLTFLLTDCVCAC